MRILGIDPGLNNMGWGIISFQNGKITHIANGTISPNSKREMAERLFSLHRSLFAVCEKYAPETSSIEEIFVNKNPSSTLKLGMARGVALMVPAKYRIPVQEYSANLVKKTVVGTGHAKKEQIQMMVKTLLPMAEIDSADAADALAVAICHAQHMGSNAQLREALAI